MPFNNILRLKSANPYHLDTPHAYCILSNDDDCMEFIDSLPKTTSMAVKERMASELSFKENTLIYFTLESLCILVMYASSRLDKGLVCVVSREIDGLVKYVNSVDVDDVTKREMYDLIAN